MVLIKHARVAKKDGERAILSLKGRGLINQEFPISSDDNFVYIPLTGDLENGEVVEIDTDPRPTRVMATGHAGGFDLIGSIAIIHERSGGRVQSIRDFIIKVKPNIKTIYLDRGIDGEMRLRNLELLYGDDNPATLYKENGLTMKVDVRSTYFSPRLSTERYIVAKSIRGGEKVFDMFSGIGPFSLNMARLTQCEIEACDINPRAVELFRENISMNKLKGNISASCGDSYQHLEDSGDFDRIIMNNPVNQYRNLEEVLKHLINHGKLNIYYIETIEGIERQMEFIEEMNMKLLSKRVVHGYSRNKFMFSLEYERQIR